MGTEGSMRAFLGTAVVYVALTLAACNQGGAGGPAGDNATPSGGPSATADAAADTGSGGVGSDIDGSAEGAPRAPRSDGSGGIGLDGSVGDGPSTPGTGATVPPVGTPLGPHVTAGKLSLDIGGTAQGTDYAFLKVAGKATLGGELHLAFAPGFAPKSGQKFIVVTAAGGISGAFAAVTTSGVAVTPGQDATTFYVTVN